PSLSFNSSSSFKHGRGAVTLDDSRADGRELARQHATNNERACKLKQTKPPLRSSKGRIPPTCHPAPLMKHTPLDMAAGCIVGDLLPEKRLRRGPADHSSFMAAGPSSSSDTSVPSFLSAPRNLIIAGPHSHDLSLHAVQKTNRSDLRRGAREAERDKGMGTVVGGPDADLSKMGERDGGEGKAYYPSSSALNYLNANDVRGRERGGEERIGEEENDDGEEDAEGKWEGEHERVGRRGQDAAEGG
ncbi:Histidinol-phosphate aminotransferase, partial [Dissostichus eleginoides]